MRVWTWFSQKYKRIQPKRFITNERGRRCFFGIAPWNHKLLIIYAGITNINSKKHNPNFSRILWKEKNFSKNFSKNFQAKEPLVTIFYRHNNNYYFKTLEEYEVRKKQQLYLYKMKWWFINNSMLWETRKRAQYLG